MNKKIKSMDSKQTRATIIRVFRNQTLKKIRKKELKEYVRP